MAILPYRAAVAAATVAELDEIHRWCQQCWPYTQGATWARGLTSQRWAHQHRDRRHKCHWYFQREADYRLFQVTWWDHLIETPELS